MPSKMTKCSLHCLIAIIILTSGVVDANLDIEDDGDTKQTQRSKRQTQNMRCRDLGFRRGDQECAADTTYLECAWDSLPMLTRPIAPGAICCDLPYGQQRIFQVHNLNQCACAQFPTFVEKSLGSPDPVNTATNPANPDIGWKGVAVFDYNNDDYDDIFYVGSNENSRGHWLFKNNGDETFEDVTVAAGLNLPTDNSAALAVDLDNDGWIDLVLGGGASQQGPQFYQNNGNGTFTRFTDTAHAPPIKPFPFFSDLDFLPFSSHISAGDYDNDGFVDLFFTSPGDTINRIYSDSRLYKNNRDMTFTDVSVDALPFTVITSCVSGFNDFDHDGFIDLYIGICNDGYIKGTPTFLFRNNGDGTFSDISGEVGLGYENNLGFPMSFTLGDWNRDGEIDIFETNLGSPDNPNLFLLKNPVLGTYEQHYSNIGPPSPFGRGSVMVDFDNDGWPDLSYVGNFIAFGWSGNPGYIYQSVPCSGSPHCDVVKRQLKEQQTLGLEEEHVSGMAYGDFNNDGWVDLVVNNVINPSIPTGGNGHLRLFMNSGVACEKQHYLDVGLVGTTSNKLGIGSTVKVELADGRMWVNVMVADSSFASTNSRYLHFGFKTALTTASVCVTWMGSGLVEKFVGGIDAKIMLTEGTGDVGC